jgi:hypothetical protein
VRYNVNYLLKIFTGFCPKIVVYLHDILRGVNANCLGGVEEAEKVGKSLKSGLSIDVVGTSHALEDFGCK